MARKKSTPRKTTKKTAKRRKLTSTKKRKNVTRDMRPKKKIMVTSSNASHHAVRANPFSSATSQPKIPDGVFTSSLSRRLQNVVEIKNANGSLGQNIMHIFMAPTLGIPVTVLNSVDGSQKRGSSSVDPSFIGFPNQTIKLHCVQGGAAQMPPVADSPLVLANMSGFSQWRIVSQGLRLELNNTDEENDGWYECCRFNWNRNPEALCLTGITGTVADKNLGYAPEPLSLYHEYGNMAMVEQPGYCNGSLKDLQKVEFTLHPQSTTHDPVLCTDKIEMLEHDSDGDVWYNNQEKVLKHRATAASNVSMAQAVDPNMDWIYIRLHCRTNNTGGNTNGSKIIANLIQNLELNFSPDSDLAVFQTMNKMDPKTAKVADAINNNPDGARRRRK